MLNRADFEESLWKLGFRDYFNAKLCKDLSAHLQPHEAVRIA